MTKYNNKEVTLGDNSVISHLFEALRLLQFIEVDKDGNEDPIITRKDVADQVRVALKNLLIGRNGYDEAISIKDLDIEAISELNNKYDYEETE